MLWRRSWTRLINSLLAAAVAREALSLDDGLENEAPEEFVDPLTAELMKSPVKLPSGNVVDDSTIRQHLLNELSDPFSRQPLEPETSTLPDLKRIEEWLAVKRGERRRTGRAERRAAAAVSYGAKRAPIRGPGPSLKRVFRVIFVLRRQCWK